jgi:hypothetical protein
MLRGVSNPREGSKMPVFLYGPRLVRSSLLYLRCSWKGYSANYLALREFYEVRGARMPPDEVSPVERAQANPETTK